MYIYMHEKSSGKTHLHQSITNMEQLKNFNMIHLGDKLRLSDNDFEAWLEELGLLHGKRTCNWRCTTRNCRKEQGYLCGTFLKVFYKNKPVQLFLPC